MVRDTFNRFDQISILVTHVGTSPSGPVSELEDDDISAAFERNLFSAVRLSREVLPHMKQQHWGRIINLLSTYAHQTATGAALSTSSQLSVMGYFKALSNELAPFNITVNNIATGPIDTELFKSRLADRAAEEGKSTDDLLKETVAEIPMNRLGKAEEVGDLAAFLASERAGYLTGTSIVVDGGRLQGIR